MADLPRAFTASAEIELSEPAVMLRRLCAHFREFGEVSEEGRCAKLETGFGSAGLEACARCLKVLATGSDDTNLAYVKLAIAENLLRLAGDDRPAIRWLGDGAEGRPLPYFREMRVVRAVPITPLMRRLTLAGDDLARFASGGLHVRLLFPKDRTTLPAWPVMGADGRPLWPEGRSRPDIRIYTLRRVDAARGEIDIDFVIHEGADTPGASFAAEALPGDIVGMTGPGGGDVPDADRLVLAGDETALPAIARILARLPGTAQATVRIEIANAGEEQLLPSAAQVDLQWLHRDGAPAGGANLLPDAVRRIILPRDRNGFFAWVGCENADYRSIRTYLRDEQKLARENHLVAAYWRLGATGKDHSG